MEDDLGTADGFYGADPRGSKHCDGGRTGEGNNGDRGKAAVIGVYDVILSFSWIREPNNSNLLPPSIPPTLNLHPLPSNVSQDFKGMSVLLAVIFLNTVIGFTQEWKASRALDALMRLGVPQAHVVRDGKPQHIDSAELVPGDIVILEEGDAVPADLRLIDVAQLEAVEAVLTGESVPVLKGTGAVKVRVCTLLWTCPIARTPPCVFLLPLI